MVKPKRLVDVETSLSLEVKHLHILNVIHLATASSHYVQLIIAQGGSRWSDWYLQVESKLFQLQLSWVKICLHDINPADWIPLQREFAAPDDEHGA